MELTNDANNVIRLYLTAPYDLVIESISVPDTELKCTSSNYIEVSNLTTLQTTISISEIDSMNKLINELLLLAKMENVGELKEYKELDISEETEIIVSMFESMAYAKNILLKSDVQENIMLNGNKEDVEHILSTLIDNAIKHTEKSKEVIVGLKKNKNSIIWQVKNMGEPIPEDEREKIFERFYRIDKSRNRKEKDMDWGWRLQNRL